MFITATCKDMKIDELTWVRRVSVEEKKKPCSTILISLKTFLSFKLLLLQFSFH